MYTRKDIKKAYLKWEKQIRLNPQEFRGDEDRLRESAEEWAEENTKYLINLMNKNK